MSMISFSQVIAKFGYEIASCNNCWIVYIATIIPTLVIVVYFGSDKVCQQIAPLSPLAEGGGQTQRASQFMKIKVHERCQPDHPLSLSWSPSWPLDGDDGDLLTSRPGTFFKMQKKRRVVQQRRQRQQAKIILVQKTETDFQNCDVHESTWHAAAIQSKKISI